jgi:hypothetical protein
MVIALIAASCLVPLAGCAPTQHRQVDDWAKEERVEPEITGDNARDEARWRQELASDPWGDDAHLLTDDASGMPSDLAAEEDVPPRDFVGPPEPPTKWEQTQKSGSKVGKALFAVLTVFVTLGMMAAPYLLMI